MAVEEGAYESTETLLAPSAAVDGMKDTENEATDIPGEIYCEKKFFDEHEDVMRMIQRLLTTHFVTAQSEVDIEYRRTFGTIVDILNRYLEQSHLLDPYLRQMVDPIVTEIQRVIASVVQERRELQQVNDGALAFPFQIYKNPRLDVLFALIYELCKVRGYKTIVNILPHEVSDFEPTLMLLQSQDRTDHMTWKTRYVLLLWLSMLCLVPFDLSTIDSSFSTVADNANGNISIVANILTLCKDYLSDPGATQIAASVCLSRLLTRPDMEAHYLDQFLTWANSELSAAYQADENVRVNQFKVTGIMRSLAHITKHSPREQHIAASRIYFLTVMQLIAKLTDEDARADRPSSSTLHRKLSVKLVQRLGLLYLPPKVRLWRYKRGMRSLELNMQMLGLLPGANDNITQPSTASLDHNDEDEDVDLEVIEELEQIVEVLLCGLRDKDTVVRWSAAKGIGRITGRLPYEYADDIVQSVLELFVASEGDGAWHGASLALAELARRGVLLPQRLSEAVQCVTRALQYDIRRGAHSIGSHVRDAACYACWSFARAYEPSLLLPWLKQTLAPAMLVNCTFDRELNCRRAASAAFQESVGRQGQANFPNGIALLTKADYFSVANLRHAYLDVSVFIATYPEYRYHLLGHLISIKISHWDARIRSLAATAIGKIGALDPPYAITNLFPRLLSSALSADVEVATRHGATLAISELIATLAQVPIYFDGELQKLIKMMPIEVDKRRLFRGRGGEMTRTAVCNVIEVIACARLSLSFAHVKKYLSILEECFVHPTESVREAAIDAFCAVTEQYCPKIFEKGSQVHVKFMQELLPRFLNAGVVVTTKERGGSTVVLNPNVAARRGFTRAIGVACKELLQPVVESCVRTLLRAASIRQQTSDEQDVESRVAAIRAIVDISSRPRNEIDLLNMEDEVARTLIDCIHLDYGVDERGDVGSWVRKEAMIGLEKLLLGESSYRQPLYYSLMGCNASSAYGNGKIVSIMAEKRSKSLEMLEEEEANPVCFVQFEKPAFGYYYFSPNGMGLIHLNDLRISAEERLKNGLVNDGTVEDSGFQVPSLSDRIDFVRQHKSQSVDGKLASSPLDRLSKSFLHRMSPQLVGDFFAALAKQLAEKLDGVRLVAGKIIFRLLHSTTPRIDGIPDCFYLKKKVFPADLAINWSMAHDTFSLVVQLIDIPEYTEAVTEGLSLSVGGLTESVVKASNSALFNWLRAHVQAKNFGLLSRFSFTLVSLLLRHQQDDRVTIPLMKTIAVLLESNLLHFLFEQRTSADGSVAPTTDFGERLYAALRDEIQKCTSIPKLNAAISMLVGLLPSEPETEKKALKALVLFLAHRFPKIRKLTAEKLYTRLLMREEVIDEAKYDSVVEILSDTAWDAPITQVRDARNELLELLEMERPQKKQRPDAGEGSGKPKGDDDTYQTLVKEMGY